jgi:uncharacterized tellurite resistance protein B-like protein
LFDTLKKVLSGEVLRNPSNKGAQAAHLDALQIAVCVVLLEVAYADESFSQEDRAQIMRFFEEGARLSKETTQELLLLAEQARKQAVELWQFTHLIAENFTVEQKLNLVEAMWTLIYIDGKLDMREDYLIHKLSTLLGLRHSELIEAKLRVLRQRGNNES